jgi:hypothetical protein
MVNVKGVLLVGRQSLNIGDNPHRLPSLREPHDPMTLLAGGAVQNCHSLRNSSGVRRV